MSIAIMFTANWISVEWTLGTQREHVCRADVQQATHTHVKLITRPTLKPEIRRHAEPYSHVCEIVAN